MLDIYHGIHLHQTCRILQCHKVGRLPVNVQQQGKGGSVAQVLHFTLCRGHGGILDGSFHLVVTGFHGTLVHQYKAYVGLIGIDGGDAGVNPHIIVQGNIIVTVGGLEAVSLGEHAVPEAML